MNSFYREHAFTTWSMSPDKWFLTLYIQTWLTLLHTLLGQIVFTQYLTMFWFVSESHLFLFEFSLSHMFLKSDLLLISTLKLTVLVIPSIHLLLLIRGRVGVQKPSREAHTYLFPPLPKTCPGKHQNIPRPAERYSWNQIFVYTSKKKKFFTLIWCLTVNFFVLDK